MEINQVRFGNYSIGNSGARNAKKEEKPSKEVMPELSGENVTPVNSEDMLNAMNIAGLQNGSNINFVARKEVNPKEFLNEERIADIEAMMAEFESGVGAVADIIGQEIPGMSEANKNALAARVFAQE